jgi:toxin ParE1/3/4
MMRAVQWSRAALDDLKNQIAYIAAENPAAARRVADRIHKSCEALGNMPTGRPGRIAGIYEKVITGLPYVIAYAITKRDPSEATSILRVIHSARDWPDGTWPT